MKNSHIISNTVGVEVLGSQLDLIKKVTFLNCLAVLHDNVDKEQFAHMIVPCYNDYGVDEITDVNLIVDALETDTAEESWYVKISLIKKVNSV